ncbi:MAG: iron-sulfur cluster-binding protein [Acidobacteria bacterium]|nr:MAG: iron-sulfur cluster-binding protein [Acidobacteriota bacterium]
MTPVTTIEAPSTPETAARAGTARVAVVRTRPETVLADYGRVMDLAGYRDTLSRDRDTLIKLNLSWTKYFPSCSSQPWQVDGVAGKMLADGYSRNRLIPIENKTVVTNPREGCRNNRWESVLHKHGLTFQPLTEVDWMVYRFKSPLLKLNDIFPEGIQIPTIYPGRQILHLPTVKTHGHAVMTGSVKNSFGGLLREVRHYAHKYMHEVLVDLLYMQRELHPAVFTVMDGTVAGDGAGPRTMIPRVKNLILAASDSVAIDAIAARLMGFDPLSIPFLRMAHERGLGIADPKQIELVGDDVSMENFGFQTRKSLVIWGDQMIRKGFLRPLERILLHSPLMVWAPFASNVYHDAVWYPTIGQARIREFMKTEWGQLFRKYS